MPQFMQAPEVEDQRRGDAEIHEIAQAIELGAEPRRALEHAGDAPIDAVEQRGEDDGGHRPFELVFDREPDRRQPGAQGQQRDEVRQQCAHRNEAEPAAGSCGTGRVERRERHVGQYSAAGA